MHLLLKLNALVNIYLTGLQQKLSRRQFMMLSSVLVGLSSGIVAVLLKLFVHYIFEFATHNKLVIFDFFIYYCQLLAFSHHYI
jgi:CIC family chloride channel protein